MHKFIFSLFLTATCSLSAQNGNGGVGISFDKPAEAPAKEEVKPQNHDDSPKGVETEGMKFFHGTLEEAQKEADKTNKLLFVDGYTSWCGPCKKMSAETFVDKKVGDFFNKHFVNYKLDMEKGEGPDFAGKYGVNAYPTMLFLNPKGDEVHRILGFRASEPFLQEGLKAIDPTGNMALMKSDIEAGKAKPETLLNYALKQAETGMDYEEIAKKYFATQTETDLLSDKNWNAINNLTDDIRSREFQFLLTKKADFVKKYGILKVEEKLMKMCMRTAKTAERFDDADTYMLAVETARKSIADNGKTADMLEIAHFSAKEDWISYADKVSALMKKNKITDAVVLNDYAWAFYQHITDKNRLAEAIKWTKQSMALDNQYYNNDTMAALLFKIGQMDEAKKYANKAIHIAQQNSEEYESTQKLLEQIEMAQK